MHVRDSGSELEDVDPVDQVQVLSARTSTYVRVNDSWYGGRQGALLLQFFVAAWVARTAGMA